MRKWCCRILTTALSAVMLSTSGIGFACEANSTISGLSTKMEEVIALTGIFGTSGIYALNYDREVTRAEFAQIFITLVGKEEEAYSYAGASLYSDVPASYQNIGFIRLAVADGYLSAYMNGSFQPEKIVTLRDAVKSSMTALGYTLADFSGNIASAQMAKFQSLGLNENIGKKETDTLTVKDCMYLVYNLLSAKNKAGVYYAESLGYSVDEDGNLYVLSMIKDDLSEPYLISYGPNLPEMTMPFETNEKTTYYLNEYRSTADSMKSCNVLYYSKDLNVVFGYSDFTTGEISSLSPSPLEVTGIVVDGKTYTLSEEMKNQVLGWTEDDLNNTYVISFGMDKEVVKIQSISDYSVNTFRGVVLWTGHSGGTYTATIAKLNGKVTTVSYDPADISLYPKDIVDVTKIGTENGISKQSSVELNAKLYDKTVEENEDDENEYLVGNYWISNKTTILAIYYDASEDEYTVEELSAYELEGLRLNASNLLYATANSSDELKQLILYAPEIMED